MSDGHGGLVSEGFTTTESAGIVAGLEWASSRLFGLLGRWASAADRPDVAVSLATASRHMGWHANDLKELEPDSEAILIHHDGQSFERLDAVLQSLERGTDPVENLAIAHRVLLARVGSGCVAVEKFASAHSDAPLARVVGFMLTDLRRDRDEGETLLEHLMSDAPTVRRVGTAVVDAEALIVDAGGLPQIAKLS